MTDRGTEDAVAATRQPDLAPLLALLDARRFADLEAATASCLLGYPNFGVLWKLLGVAQRLQGKDALAALGRASELLPKDAEAQGNFGAALLDRGSLAEAEQRFRTALALAPTSPLAHYQLGTTLYRLGRFDAAMASYRSALDLDPGSAATHFELGNAAWALGLNDVAMASYGAAIDRNPEHVGARVNLGNGLLALGRRDEALAQYRAAIAIDPGRAAAHNGLGNALSELGRVEDAAASYLRAIELQPDFAKAHINLGLVQRSLVRPAEAEACARRALAIDDRDAAAWVLLGDLHADAGRFQDAEAAYRRAVELDPGSAEGWAGIANQRRMTAADAPWLAQAERLAAASLPPRREATLRFAMGKYCDDLQDFDQAFSHYQRANELTKQFAVSYDREAWSRRVDRRIEAYTAQRLRVARTADRDPARAVFVVGMPRSGTSLTEQILASHPAVFGAGELPFWEQAAVRLDLALPPAELATEYLTRLAAAAPAALRVVDKMPANYLHLGLIHEALPNARILHMQRDPLDTCLSIYFQQFRITHAYSHDLGDLAHYYGEYRRIMQHWREVLPQGVMLEIPYEDLVDDQETWSRRMVEFVGLPWDPACLEFHLAERTVATASQWQVRQKLNRGSVGRWRHYAQFLEPLICGLKFTGSIAGVD
jgi:tetratricopeptide (TPR) repeat protein